MTSGRFVTGLDVRNRSPGAVLKLNLHPMKLPPRPSLRRYEMEARHLIASVKSGKPQALRSIRQYHRPWRKLPDAQLRKVKVSLADAKRIIARDEDFRNWQQLKRHTEALNDRTSDVARFEAAADSVATGDVTTLRRLLEASPELIRARSPRMHRATLLHYAGANGVEAYRQQTPPNAVEVVDLLVQAGAELDSMADMYGGATPLGLVATSVHPYLAGVQNALMAKLLKHGAAINHPGAAGNRHSIVNGCLANGRPGAAVFLARRGAHLDLEAAAGVGRLDVVRRFFDARGRLRKATSAQMKSGFNWACAYGRKGVVEFLLPKGIDLAERHRGETGLHWASYGGHLSIVKLLLKQGAPVGSQDETWSNSPLGWAMYGWAHPSPEFKRVRHAEVVAQLIAAGSPIELRWHRRLKADPRTRAALRRRLAKEAARVRSPD